MLNIIEEMFSFFHFKTQIVPKGLYLDVGCIDKAQTGIWREKMASTYYFSQGMPVGGLLLGHHS